MNTLNCIAPVLQQPHPSVSCILDVKLRGWVCCYILGVRLRGWVCCYVLGVRLRGWIVVTFWVSGCVDGFVTFWVSDCVDECVVVTFWVSSCVAGCVVTFWVSSCVVVLLHSKASSQCLNKQYLRGTVHFPTRIPNGSVVALDNIFIDKTRNHIIGQYINGTPDHDAQVVTLNNIFYRNQSTMKLTKYQ